MFKGGLGAEPPRKNFGGGVPMTETAIVVQKAYEWNLWILPKVEEISEVISILVGPESGIDIARSVDEPGGRDLSG